MFWKTVKSFFSDKSNNFENISLIENSNLLTDDFEIAETFNKCFQNLVPNSDPKVPNNLLCQTPENGDVVLYLYLKSLDQLGEYAALLTDLSRAFNCLPQDLIIAKLHAYGFLKASLRLMHKYLTGRYQRVKIKIFYSFWSLIKPGVPQVLILGLALFNIF